MNGTRTVKVGKVMVGGDWPVSVQTMWKDPVPLPGSPAFESAVGRIESLSLLGCDILRFAVPDLASAEALGALAARSVLPLVADIHFDWRIALHCMDFPIAKIRVNPGNIGARWKVAEVVAKAKDKGIPIRIGVNAGSLPEDLRDVKDRAVAVVEAAEREVAIFDDLGFSDIVVSMKVSDVDDTIEANRRFASRHDIPLHLGVTEAGPLIAGVARNTAALVPLLRENIGSTIRVSLSDSCESEVLAGREILACAGRARKGISIVSCPRCGRASFDTHAFTARWAERLYSRDLTATVAVMGCVVNGPGEARDADLGIAGGAGKGVLFKHGKVVKMLPEAELLPALLREIRAAARPGKPAATAPVC
jgi:(E)-4-hydroxy-3-methylbut-2-enyl-diphosphate synthase